MNGDDFIANLWKVHLRVKEEGYAQVLGIFPRCEAALSMLTPASHYLWGYFDPTT